MIERDHLVVPNSSSFHDRPASEGSAGASRPMHRTGKVRPAILLWALGVPIPLVILFLIIRGCAM